MKFAVSLFAAALLVAAQAAPAPEPDSVRVVRQSPAPFQAGTDPLSQLLQDSLREVSSQEALSRPIRQAGGMQTPLSQLLFDILQIPQAALQAVSMLLTNPNNSIGQSFNFANRRQNPQQQPASYNTVQ